MKRLQLNGLEDTRRLAGHLAAFAEPGMIVCLSGDLGAGKTTFTQALAKALGITEHVSSPSFTLIHEYHSGRMPLYHMDMYRIDDLDELEEIGFDEYLAPHALVVVEWAERIEELLPGERLHLQLMRCNEPDNRVLELPGITETDRRFIEALQAFGEVLE